MNTIDLSAYDILRPEKVRWIFPAGYINPLDGVRSDSLRKFLSNSEQILRTNGIVYQYGEVTMDQYREWYKFYEQNMEEREYSILAPQNLINEKELEGKKVEGIFLYKDEKMIGGGIIVRKGVSFASFAYKASLRMDISNRKNSSLGAVIDYLYLVKMTDQHVKVISGGRSRNAFGVLNSLNHMEYKLRMGYVPIPAEESPLLTDVPIDEKGYVAFLGVQHSKQILVQLKKKLVQISVDLEKFSTSKLQYRLIEKDEV